MVCSTRKASESSEFYILVKFYIMDKVEMLHYKHGSEVTDQTLQILKLFYVVVFSQIHALNFKTSFVSLAVCNTGLRINWSSHICSSKYISCLKLSTVLPYYNAIFGVHRYRQCYK